MNCHYNVQKSYLDTLTLHVSDNYCYDEKTSNLTTVLDTDKFGEYRVVLFWNYKFDVIL